MSEDSVKHLAPVQLKGPIAASEIKKYFGPRSDLTYRTIEGVTLSDLDLYQSLLTGSLIRDSFFQRVVFARADLDGLRVEGSTFLDCDFTTCDIRSNVFSRCRFERCIFADSFINDCQFQACELTNSSFKNAIIAHCRFNDSHLSSCGLSPGTFLHNKLYSCQLSNMVLGDCTLLYLILRDCSFVGITINAESVGAIFGLTHQQLVDAEIIYLGTHEPIPESSNVVHLMYEEYRRRNWYLGQLILSLNYALASTVGAFDNYLSDTLERFATMGFAKGDELEFLEEVLQELATRESLPLLVTLNILDWCGKLEGHLSNAEHYPESKNSDESLTRMANCAVFLTNTLIEKLEASVPLVDYDRDDTLYVKAAFRVKPTHSLISILNSLSEASALRFAERSSLIRVESGSYIEIISTTLFSILALQIFLFLINGCVIQLTELKQRLRVLARKGAPKTYKEMALVPIQQASPILLTSLRGVAQYAKGLPWLKDSFLSGFVASNIESLRVIEQNNDVKET